MTFAGKRVADLQIMVADVRADAADGLVDQRVAHAASRALRSWVGAWPKRREKARVKLALLR